MVRATAYFVLFTPITPNRETFVTFGDEGKNMWWDTLAVSHNVYVSMSDTTQALVLIQSRCGQGDHGLEDITE